MNGLSVESLDCPQVCGFAKPQINIRRDRFCEKCPRTKRRVEFQRETERLFEAWMPDESVDFAEMYEHFTNILPLRETADREIPAWAGRLLGIYNAENDRYDRIEAELK